MSHHSVANPWKKHLETLNEHSFEVINSYLIYVHSGFLDITFTGRTTGRTKRNLIGHYVFDFVMKEDETVESLISQIEMLLIDSNSKLGVYIVPVTCLYNTATFKIRSYTPDFVKAVKV